MDMAGEPLKDDVTDKALAVTAPKQSAATARGCAATYFPEGNVLVPLASIAEGSNTPVSKSIIVRLEPARPLTSDRPLPGGRGHGVQKTAAGGSPQCGGRSVVSVRTLDHTEMDRHLAVQCEGMHK